jgi:hypothetical protein
MATNLARIANYRHYFVAVLHAEGYSPDPWPNGQIRLTTACDETVCGVAGVSGV